MEAVIVMAIVAGVPIAAIATPLLVKSRRAVRRHCFALLGLSVVSLLCAAVLQRKLGDHVLREYGTIPLSDDLGGCSRECVTEAAWGGAKMGRETGSALQWHFLAWTVALGILVLQSNPTIEDSNG